MDTGKKAATDKVVNVTTDRGAHPESYPTPPLSHWHVAMVRTCCERKAENCIARLGIESWVPVQTERRVWSDRIKKVDNVIIPSMCFFHLACNTKKEASRKLLSVLKEPYILKILTMPGSSAPAVIPDNQIQQLKYMLNYADSPVLFSEGRHFKKGDRVRVCRGKLKDFEGYVTRTTDGSTSIFITVDYLGCASMEISPNDIQAIDETAPHAT